MGIAAQGVVGAGLLVSLSDRASSTTFKEAGALSKHVVAAKPKQHERARTGARGRTEARCRLTSSPDKVEHETLEALRSRRPRSKPSTGRAEPYRQFVVEVAHPWRTPPEAASRGSGAIEKVRSAIG